MAISKPLIDITNVTALAGEKEILHNVSLALDAGTCHVLMGPNGAGKSTLGHVIMADPSHANVQSRVGWPLCLCSGTCRSSGGATVQIFAHHLCCSSGAQDDGAPV